MQQHKQRYYYSLSLYFAAPLLSQASGTLNFGIDAAMLRDTEGEPALNGSLVRGNIRHALEDFQRKTNDSKLARLIDQWFGKRHESGNLEVAEQSQDDRANVEFDFFWRLQNAERSASNVSKHCTRIELDNEKGKVNDASLQVIEDCFPVGGEQIHFKGAIVVYLSNDQVSQFERWFNKALQYIPAMGSFKGIGFGRLLQFDLKPLEHNPYANSPLQLNADDATSRYQLSLKIDRPFCVGRLRTPESNRIFSPDIISGSIIKGVLSRAYPTDLPPLNETLCFDDLIVRHAMPVLSVQRERATVLPLSLVKIGDELLDAAFISEQELLEKAGENILKFVPDWKYDDKQAAYGFCTISRVSPKTYLSVKTGIDATHNTSSTGQLFSLECIVPTDELRWCSEVVLDNISPEKRQTVLNHLCDQLGTGLQSIGKTKANASVSLKPLPAKPQLPVQDNQSAIVMLNTEAKLLPAGLSINNSNSYHELEKAYQAYWKQVHPDIKLKRYFAQQHLASAYPHLKKHQSSQPYQPDYLTQAGSVFILSLPSKTAVTALNHCLNTGLPVYQQEEKAISWRDTPYLPENGYGEIELRRKEQVGGKQ